MSEPSRSGASDRLCVLHGHASATGAAPTGG
jgi:hypothetical protein